MVHENAACLYQERKGDVARLLDILVQKGYFSAAVVPDQSQALQEEGGATSGAIVGASPSSTAAARSIHRRPSSQNLPISGVSARLRLKAKRAATAVEQATAASGLTGSAPATAIAPGEKYYHTRLEKQRDEKKKKAFAALLAKRRRRALRRRFIRKGAGTGGHRGGGPTAYLRRLMRRKKALRQGTPKVVVHFSSIASSRASPSTARSFATANTTCHASPTPKSARRCESAIERAIQQQRSSSTDHHVSGGDCDGSGRRSGKKHTDVFSLSLRHIILAQSQSTRGNTCNTFEKNETTHLPRLQRLPSHLYAASRFHFFSSHRSSGAAGSRRRRRRFVFPAASGVCVLDAAAYLAALQNAAAEDGDGWVSGSPSGCPTTRVAVPTRSAIVKRRRRLVRGLQTALTLLQQTTEKMEEKNAGGLLYDASHMLSFQWVNVRPKTSQEETCREAHPHPHCRRHHEEALMALLHSANKNNNNNNTTSSDDRAKMKQSSDSVPVFDGVLRLVGHIEESGSVVVSRLQWWCRPSQRLSEVPAAPVDLLFVSFSLPMAGDGVGAPKMSVGPSSTTSPNRLVSLLLCPPVAEVRSLLSAVVRSTSSSSSYSSFRLVDVSSWASVAALSSMPVPFSLISQLQAATAASAVGDNDAIGSTTNAQQWTLVHNVSTFETITTTTVNVSTDSHQRANRRDGIQATLGQACCLGGAGGRSDASSFSSASSAGDKRAGSKGRRGAVPSRRHDTSNPSCDALAALPRLCGARTAVISLPPGRFLRPTRNDGRARPSKSDDDDEPSSNVNHQQDSTRNSTRGCCEVQLHLVVSFVSEPDAMWSDVICPLARHGRLQAQGSGSTAQATDSSRRAKKVAAKRARGATPRGHNEGPEAGRKKDDDNDDDDAAFIEDPHPSSKGLDDKCSAPPVGGVDAGYLSHFFSLKEAAAMSDKGGTSVSSITPVVAAVSKVSMWLDRQHRHHAATCHRQLVLRQALTPVGYMERVDTMFQLGLIGSAVDPSMTKVVEKEASSPVSFTAQSPLLKGLYWDAIMELPLSNTMSHTTTSRSRAPLIKRRLSVREGQPKREHSKRKMGRRKASARESTIFAEIGHPAVFSDENGSDAVACGSDLTQKVRVSSSSRRGSTGRTRVQRRRCLRGVCSSLLSSVLSRMITCVAAANEAGNQKGGPAATTTRNKKTPAIVQAALHRFSQRAVRNPVQSGEQQDLVASVMQWNGPHEEDVDKKRLELAATATTPRPTPRPLNAKRNRSQSPIRDVISTKGETDLAKNIAKSSSNLTADGQSTAAAENATAPATAPPPPAFFNLISRRARTMLEKMHTACCQRHSQWDCAISSPPPLSSSSSSSPLRRRVVFFLGNAPVYHEWTAKILHWTALLDPTRSYFSSASFSSISEATSSTAVCPPTPIPSPAAAANPSAASRKSSTTKRTSVRRTAAIPQWQCLSVDQRRLVEEEIKGLYRFMQTACEVLWKVPVAHPPTGIAPSPSPTTLGFGNLLHHTSMIIVLSISQQPRYSSPNSHLFSSEGDPKFVGSNNDADDADAAAVAEAAVLAGPEAWGRRWRSHCTIGALVWPLLLLHTHHPEAMKTPPPPAVPEAVVASTTERLTVPPVGVVVRCTNWSEVTGGPAVAIRLFSGSDPPTRSRTERTENCVISSTQCPAYRPVLVDKEEPKTPEAGRCVPVRYVVVSDARPSTEASFVIATPHPKLMTPF